MTIKNAPTPLDPVAYSTHIRGLISVDPAKVVTPEWAEAVLKRMKGNRPYRAGNAAGIARDITAGHFVYTGDPIVLDEDGVCIQGQHRLRAVVLSGIPIVTCVIEGVPRAGMAYMDSGTRRSIGDQLHCQGVANSKDAAGIVTVSIGWEASDPSLRPTNTEAIIYYHSHPDVDRATRIARKAERANRDVDMRLRSCGAFALRALAAPGVTEAAVTDFLMRVAVGDGEMPGGTPINRLHKMFSVWKADQRKRVSRERWAHLAALTLGWNAAVNYPGATVKQEAVELKAGDAFPALIAPNGKPVLHARTRR